jgi:hypothetical protein
MFQEINNGILFEVKIIPKSSKNEIIGWEENRLKVKIKEIPEKGKANKELIGFLSKTLKIAKSNIKIVKGETSRIKKVEIYGINAATAAELLATPEK